MTHELAKTFKEELFVILRKSPFLGSGTTSCFHCFVTLTTDLVCTSLVNLVNTNEIPWEIVLVILMDSCDIMRGCKNGVETKIRKNYAPCETFIVMHFLVDNLFTVTPMKTSTVSISQIFIS